VIIVAIVAAVAIGIVLGAFANEIGWWLHYQDEDHADH
jgi:hypothetical protein